MIAEWRLYTLLASSRHFVGGTKITYLWKQVYFTTSHKTFFSNWNKMTDFYWHGNYGDESRHDVIFEWTVSGEGSQKKNVALMHCKAVWKIYLAFSECGFRVKRTDNNGVRGPILQFRDPGLFRPFLNPQSDRICIAGCSAPFVDAGVINDLCIACRGDLIIHLVKVIQLWLNIEWRSRTWRIRCVRFLFHEKCYCNYLPCLEI